ncbi:MAG: hypothetical protein MPJ50_07040 [Pirellulales bacterium]|nr:hypothetical protein [Pirellulales bacterium]
MKVREHGSAQGDQKVNWSRREECLRDRASSTGGQKKPATKMAAGESAQERI